MTSKTSLELLRPLTEEHKAQGYFWDDNTGLPKLPEGFYWKIGRIFGDTFISLNRSRRMWFAEKVEFQWIFSSITRSGVRLSSMRILESVNDKLTSMDHKIKFGKYPPIRLPEADR